MRKCLAGTAPCEQVWLSGGIPLDAGGKSTRIISVSFQSSSGFIQQVTNSRHFWADFDRLLVVVALKQCGHISKGQ